MATRVTPSKRIRAEIDEVFGSDRELGAILEDVARLRVRLLMQAALEAEFTEFLGRERYARGERARDGSLNGYQEVTRKTTAGAITLHRPKSRGTSEAFASRLLGKGVTRTNALESLVIAGFVRGLSVHDVEAALACSHGSHVLRDARFCPMKVGVQLPEVEREVGWRELAGIARAAEDGGFDSVWVGDHYLYEDPPRGPWEAWSLLAAIAAVTSRVEIGPLVACLGFHNPAVLAKKVATVDEISEGRLILGVGAGWNRVEFDAFGIPFDNRVERFEDSFTILRELLSHGESSHAGKFHRIRECRLLPRPRRVPPMMIGSIGPRMLSLTLPFVEMHHAWFAWFGNDGAGIRTLQLKIDESCRAVGRDPATLERSVALYVQLPEGGGRMSGDIASRESPPIPLPRLPEVLSELAAERIGHVQLVLDPITRESVEGAARVINSNLGAARD